MEVTEHVVSEDSRRLQTLEIPTTQEKNFRIRVTKDARTLQKIPNVIQRSRNIFKVLGAESILHNKSTSFGRNIEHMIDFYRMVHMQRSEVYDLKKHQRVILKHLKKMV